MQGCLPYISVSVCACWVRALFEFFILYINPLSMSVKRKFRLSDDRLLEFAGVVRGHLAKHEAEMQAFDGSVSLAWYDPLFEAGRDATLDRFERASVGAATQFLQEQKQICHDLYRQVRYFVRIAFADSPGRLEPFDLGSYAAVYSSHHKLLHFMRSFVKHMREEDSVLVATGARPALLDEMEAAVGRFDEALSVATNRKHRRRAHTRDRVEALNALYAAIQRLSELASFVFDPEETPTARFFKVPATRRGRKRVQPVEDAAEVGLSPKGASVQEEIPAAMPAKEGSAPATAARVSAAVIEAEGGFVAPCRAWGQGLRVVAGAGREQRPDAGYHTGAGAPPSGDG